MFVIHRPQRVNRSPGPGPQPAGRNSPGNAVTSMVSINYISPSHIEDCLISKHVVGQLFLFFFLQLSPSFTPTSVIRKMYATKEKSRDEPLSVPDAKEEQAAHSQDGTENLPELLDLKLM